MIEADILKEKLQRSFGLYEDLVQSLQEENLGLDLAGLPSNTIGQQLWCVVGARQSYLKAILAGRWQGFACGLDWKSTTNKTAVLQHLSNTKNEFLTSIEKLQSLTTAQQSLMVDLIEHEAQHHVSFVPLFVRSEDSSPRNMEETLQPGLTMKVDAKLIQPLSTLLTLDSRRELKALRPCILKMDKF